MSIKSFLVGLLVFNSMMMVASGLPVVYPEWKTDEHPSLRLLAENLLRTKNPALRDPFSSDLKNRYMKCLEKAQKTPSSSAACQELAENFCVILGTERINK